MSCIITKVTNFVIYGDKEAAFFDILRRKFHEKDRNGTVIVKECFTLVNILNKSIRIYLVPFLPALPFRVKRTERIDYLVE